MVFEMNERERNTLISGMVKAGGQGRDTHVWPAI
jgi:hypothetical protein